MFKLLISVSISVIGCFCHANVKVVDQRVYFGDCFCHANVKVVDQRVYFGDCFGHSNVKVVDQRVYFGDWLFRSQQCLSC